MMSDDVLARVSTFCGPPWCGMLLCVRRTALGPKDVWRFDGRHPQTSSWAAVARERELRRMCVRSQRRRFPDDGSPLWQRSIL